MCLSHPQTIPSLLIHGKTVFLESDPWYQKVGLGLHSSLGVCSIPRYTHTQHLLYSPWQSPFISVS